MSQTIGSRTRAFLMRKKLIWHMTYDHLDPILREHPLSILVYSEYRLSPSRESQVVASCLHTHDISFCTIDTSTWFMHKKRTFDSLFARVWLRPHLSFRVQSNPSHKIGVHWRRESWLINTTIRTHNTYSNSLALNLQPLIIFHVLESARERERWSQVGLD